MISMRDKQRAKDGYRAMRENGSKQFAGNNETQTLSARMPRASPKAPS